MLTNAKVMVLIVAAQVGLYQEEGGCHLSLICVPPPPTSAPRTAGEPHSGADGARCFPALLPGRLSPLPSSQLLCKGVR